MKGTASYFPKKLPPRRNKAKKRVIDHVCHDMKRCVLTARKRSKHVKTISIIGMSKSNGYEKY